MLASQFGLLWCLSSMLLWLFELFLLGVWCVRASRENLPPLPEHTARAKKFLCPSDFLPPGQKWRLASWLVRRRPHFLNELGGAHDDMWMVESVSVRSSIQWASTTSHPAGLRSFLALNLNLPRARGRLKSRWDSRHQGQV